MGKNRDFSKFPNAITVLDNGSVGINNTSPSYSLDVYNIGNNIAIRIHQPSATTTNYNTIYFTGNHTSVMGYIGTGGSTAANTALRDAYYLGTQTAHPIVFTSSDAGRMILTSGGNLGIGTLSPTGTTKVEISAGEGLPTLRLNRTTNAGYGSQLHFSSLTYNRFAIGLNPSDDLYIDRDTSSTGTGSWNPTTFIIQRSTGNVGINIANPTSQLMVYGGANTATFVNTNSASNSNVQLGNNNLTNGAGMALFGSAFSSSAQYRASGAYFYSNQSGGLTVHAENNNSIYLATNNVQRITIDGSGDIYLANTITPLNLKPENTFATAITNLASSAATYNYKPGVYWISYGGATFLSYVRFNWHQGRNWVLALKCHNVHDMTSGNPLWQNNTLINQSDFDLNSGRMAKYAAWNYFPFTRLLYQMGNRIPPIMQWNSSKTSLYSVFSGISVGNGSGVGCDSTDPQISTSASTTYYGMANFLGAGFDGNYGGAEVNINFYGLGSFANNSTNSTSGANTGSSTGFGLVTEHLGSFSGLQSTGRSGAWIGCPLDEGAHVFNAPSASGADSGFGLGVCGGNNPRTTTSGIISWALGNSVANYLPAYVWLSID